MYKKKIFIFTLFVILNSFSVFSFDHIGVININKCINYSHEVHDINHFLNKKYYPKEQIFLKNKIKIEKHINQLEKSNLNKNQLINLRKKILHEEKDLINFQKNVKKNYVLEKKKFFSKFFIHLNKSIKKVSYKNKINILFKKHCIPYINKNNNILNITNEVISDINQGNKKLY